MRVRTSRASIPGKVFAVSPSAGKTLASSSRSRAARPIAAGCRPATGAASQLDARIENTALIRGVTDGRRGLTVFLLLEHRLRPGGGYNPDTRDGYRLECPALQDEGRRRCVACPSAPR